MNPNSYRTEFSMDTTATAKTQATPGTSTRDLSEAIVIMDSLSQEAFQQIMSIAKLALLSLEIPDGHRSFTSLAYALEAIVGKADEAMGCVNYEAEKVGHPWRDEARERRSRASREAALHS